MMAVNEARRYIETVQADAIAAAPGTHCSACGRKLRPKVMAGGAGPSNSFPAPWVDWLNHRRSCPRYGQDPDLRPAHRRVYVPTRRLADGGREARAKCDCGWVALWPRTQREAADAFRAHKTNA